MKKVLPSLWFKLLAGFLGLALLLSALIFTGVSLYMGAVGYFETPPTSFESSVEFDLVTNELGLSRIYYNLIWSHFDKEDGAVSYYDYRDYPSGFYYTLSSHVGGVKQRVYSNFESLPDTYLITGNTEHTELYHPESGVSQTEYYDVQYWEELYDENGERDPNYVEPEFVPVDYTVEYWIDTDQPFTSAYGLARLLYEMTSGLGVMNIILGVACYVAFFFCMILLFCGVGRRVTEEGSQLYLNAFDRCFFIIPLGLAAAFCVGGAALITVAFELLRNEVNYLFVALLSTVGGVILAYIGLMIVLSTFIARVKNGQFIKTTLTYKVLCFVWWLLKWIFRILLDWILKPIGRFFRKVSDFFYAIPLVWRTAGVWALGLLIMSVLQLLSTYSFGATFIVTLIYAGILLLAAVYSAVQLKTVTKTAQHLAKGELDRKLDTTGLFFDYKTIGDSLNSVSDSISLAVDERMKSERLKTELITNVSHDVKTPLTSIINYVDLLKKEELPSDRAKEYLSVVDKQSQRLKKMLEDLTEASKAATGNIKPKSEPVDLSELLMQSVGEYEGKMEAAGLTCILKKPEKPVVISADGTLVWRCVNNLLSNAVKYSLSGTRVYITLEEKGNTATVTFRNISREEINVSPDELTERFVRGDASRNSEGSGLGLAIVKSFAELMGGSFSLSVDGDLFKAELKFNA